MGGTTNKGVTGRGHKWRCNWEGGRDCEGAPMEMKLGGDQKWRCNWEGVTKNGGVTVRDHKLRCNCEGSPMEM